MKIGYATNGAYPVNFIGFAPFHIESGNRNPAIPGPLPCPCPTHHWMDFGQDFISEGRNEARGWAPKASADLIDFYQVNGLSWFSSSFAGGNLHFVASQFARFSRYFSVIVLLMEIS